MALLAAAFLAALPAFAVGAGAIMVTDPLTGVALNGVDAVSYFTEPEPLAGLPDYEYDWGGVPWYFANAANRDIFIKAPEVYAPQFAGHATMSLARGYFSDGNPQIYRIVASRLYLFYSIGNRDAFMLAPAAALTEARQHWQGFTAPLSAANTP